MDRNEASRRLRALAADDENRSKAARLRDVYPDVEAALAAGVSRTRVLQELAALGLEMTPATFFRALGRIRQKVKADAVPLSQAAEPAPTGDVPPSSLPVNHG